MQCFFLIFWTKSFWTRSLSFSSGPTPLVNGYSDPQAVPRPRQVHCFQPRLVAYFIVKPSAASHSPPLVDEFDEPESGVLLYRVLPLLRAKHHHQLDHRRVGLHANHA